MFFFFDLSRDERTADGVQGKKQKEEERDDVTVDESVVGDEHIFDDHVSLSKWEHKETKGGHERRGDDDDVTVDEEVEDDSQSFDDHVSISQWDEGEEKVVGDDLLDKELLGGYTLTNQFAVSDSI